MKDWTERKMNSRTNRAKVVVGGGRFTFLQWCRDNNLSPLSKDICYVGHNEEAIMGLELKHDDIVRLGGVSHRMEQLIRSRIR